MSKSETATAPKPEVALFITLLGSTKSPKPCCETMLLKRSYFRWFMNDAELTRLMPDENSDIEVELKNRAFFVRSKANGFIKMIWPNQTVSIKIGEFDFEFRTGRCNY